MKPTVTIMWFEQDLRLCDNPALCSALMHPNVLPAFILDDKNAGGFHLGGASQCWLHESLNQLDQQLHGQLNFYQGDAVAIISDLLQRFNVTRVFWNRRYEPWRIARDTHIKKMLTEQGVKATSYNGALLNEPWTVLKPDQTPYKVFSPYHRQCLKNDSSSLVLPAPSLPTAMVHDEISIPLLALSLRPKHRWGPELMSHWQPGELGAHNRLREFLASGLESYKDNRDYPAMASVSRLSPHLHFGELSPRQVKAELLGFPNDNNKEIFVRELFWREFSTYVLFHWPSLPSNNFQTSFDHFPWREDASSLSLWQQGLTGYPIIDAGMRELWQTGYMHNRVRMITASFLVKNLLLDWRLGAHWFWDCLVDADLANNSASWQWVAGSGTDAAPYFRIFNPVTQGEKFDPQGDYTKHFLPELKDLPMKFLFRPWQAPTEVLKQANIVLGETYPNPIVDIKASRERALDAIKHVSQIKAP